MLSAVSYAQERRADEHAAAAAGDRLVVASALVRIGSAAGPRALSCQPSVAGAHFGMFRVPVAERVRRLIAESRRRSRTRGTAKALAAGCALAGLAVLLLGAVRAGDLYERSGGRDGLLTLAGTEPRAVSGRSWHAAGRAGGELCLSPHVCDDTCEPDCGATCDLDFDLPRDPAGCRTECRALVAGFESR